MTTDSNETHMPTGAGKSSESLHAILAAFGHSATPEAAQPAMTAEGMRQAILALIRPRLLAAMDDGECHPNEHGTANTLALLVLEIARIRV